MRLSDSGLSGSSADTSLRILARIAVDDISVPSLAATWLEKKYELEQPGRVHVLVGRDARDRRLVHPHGFGDVLEDHRLQVLVATLEECRLPLHDATRDFQQRFVADFQAANQPARFLQLGAQHRVIGGAADEAGIASG